MLTGSSLVAMSLGLTQRLTLTIPLLMVHLSELPLEVAVNDLSPITSDVEGQM